MKQTADTPKTPKQHVSLIHFGLAKTKNAWHLQQAAQLLGEGAAQRLLARDQRQAAGQAPHHRVRGLRPRRNSNQWRHHLLQTESQVSTRTRLPRQLHSAACELIDGGDCILAFKGVGRCKYKRKFYTYSTPGAWRLRRPPWQSP